MAKNPQLPMVYFMPELAPDQANVCVMRERFENLMGLKDGQGANYYFDQKVEGVEVWGFLSLDAALLFRAPKGD